MNRLIDSHNRVHNYLRISVTDRCNFRCKYCIPDEAINWQPKSEILTYDEIIRISNILVNNGVTKIRLTGGEPLARKNIEYLIFKLTSLQGVEEIGVTTNGYFLKNQIRNLKNAGLKSINISIDSLTPEKFYEITSHNVLNIVLDGIYAALEADFNPVKLNVVVIRGFNDNEILDFVNYVKDKPIQVRFIEYMPFKNNRWRESGFVPYEEMKTIISAKYNLVPFTNGNVSKDFSIDGFTGSVGFITSISNHFCGTCNRLRLTADGHLKSCLFSNDEVRVKELLRSNASDDEICSLIINTLKRKNEMHDGVAGLLKIENRAMIQIGG